MPVSAHCASQITQDSSSSCIDWSMVICRQLHKDPHGFLTINTITSCSVEMANSGSLLGQGRRKAHLAAAGAAERPKLGQAPPAAAGHQTVGQAVYWPHWVALSAPAAPSPCTSVLTSDAQHAASCRRICASLPAVSTNNGQAACCPRWAAL